MNRLFYLFKCALIFGTALVLTLQGCTHIKPYNIDSLSAKHPATPIFIKYIKAVKKEKAFDALSGFFTPEDNKTISQASGWYLFGYSASYKALTQGHCTKITTKVISRSRAQIDCTGDFTFKSYFLGDSQEKMHLRVFMVMQNNHWYLTKSGYAHTQENGKAREFGRVGLKFKSIFEQ